MSTPLRSNDSAEPKSVRKLGQPMRVLLPSTPSGADAAPQPAGLGSARRIVPGANATAVRGLYNEPVSEPP